MKKVLLFAAFIIMPAFLFAEGDVLVLCYHTFLGKPKIMTDFSAAQLESQIDSMEKLGYRFVSIEDVLSGNVTGRKNVLITIDDGNHSVRTIYDPILKRKGIKPVLFISPAIIDHVFYALKKTDLDYYQRSGATLGAHGYNHLYINEKLYSKDKVSFNREIYHSKKRISELAGKDVRIFAYPFGDFSQITKDNLRLAGFDMSFSLRRDYMKVPLNRNSDLYDLPRWMVTQKSWPEIYNKMKRDSGVPLMTSGKITDVRSSKKDAGSKVR